MNIVRQYILGFWIVSVSFCCLSVTQPTQAQQEIVPDTTLPINSNVELKGNTFNITGGTQAGSNLFHSFQQFSVPTGGTAFFYNAVDIQNIISRVTGGSISNIDGLIRANGTNLFLINPNGIVFGPNASLNVGGSFVASTASSLKFADGFEFSATAPQTTPLLTISVPIGLQFPANPGSIQNQSTGLQVKPGKTLALVGGDVNLDGGVLTARNGRVELGGLATTGTVGLNIDDNNFRLSFPDGVARANVSLNQATVDVTADEGGGSIAVNARNLDILGGSNLVAGINLTGTQAGDITLNATDKTTIADSSVSNDVGDILSQPIGNSGTININTGSLSLNNAQVSSSTYGVGNAGGVFVQANNSVDIANSSISSDVNSQAEGNTGGVNIKAGSFSLTDDANLTASISGKGNTPGVSLQANNSVDIANSFIYTGVDNDGVGSGGDINIRAGKISLTNNSTLDTTISGQGRAGNVIFDAQNTVSFDKSFIASDTDGLGNSGIINIKARALSLRNGAEILSRALGENNGGSIQINASEVNISGVNPEQGNLISGLITSSEGNATGKGGDISINADKLSVSDGGVVSARSGSAGSGGNINVDTNTLDLTGGGQLLTSAFSSGSAGNITVNAKERVSISGSNPIFQERVDRYGTQLIDNDSPNSGLFARVTGTGNATASGGNIEVTSPLIFLDKQGTIAAATTAGAGGNITLNVRDILLLRNNSSITASAGTAEASGNAGNITINAPNGFVVAVPNENSDITANAFSDKAGIVKITASGIFGLVPRDRAELVRLLQPKESSELNPSKLQTSDITAISQQNPLLSNTVEFNTEINPSLGLVVMPTNLVDASSLIASGCAVDGTQDNQFIVTGRGGLPPSPDEFLTNDVVWQDTRLSSAVEKVGSLENGNISKQRSDRITQSIKKASNTVKIIPATGWVFNNRTGEVSLISNASVATPDNLASTPGMCPKQ
ncbi:filamentous hemagglutinin N-terminal domain-containing protein [Hassallia byssoidea VB512170]|uniref:Filamentous hemagglutinin N-terminal domain-containing protein n=1 Tax=Hassallia byssoidea VB512170 TaxID=1304833 RepID=A0A846HC97_9CYAN|nr:filamentous hemagglutinin N-terminal domain-containing protein [Hassalia byssoidea]NEU74304.1 filamentous hemagglutinin N-terminal domain-containing protein [Hassalia byssoidea VB512170]